MKFSVIIPVFNSAQTICRAIDSVLSQTYKDFEVIVVDDASIDGSATLVADRYGDQVSVLTLNKNSGSSSARNAGIAIAGGDFLAFLDSDDSWHPEKLEVISAVLVKRPDISFIYHSYTLSGMSALSSGVDLSPKKLSYVRLMAGNVISTSCVVLKNGMGLNFANDMRYCEDYDLWLRVAYRYGVYLVDFPLTRLYRPIRSEGGISSALTAMRLGEMKAYGRLPGLNPFFSFLVPLLWMGSVAKHLLKKLRLI